MVRYLCTFVTWLHAENHAAAQTICRCGPYFLENTLNVYVYNSRLRIWKLLQLHLFSFFRGGSRLCILVTLNIFLCFFSDGHESFPILNCCVQ